ncbi:flavin reductase family protein [Oceanirhabdus seepicola]|uniref:Flavin reductase family protein n=1 Tax=Oceanirhabdus seepicola TaxID=2828781 RepID=A0A9J6P8W0_9CLOT|nr:flavin reductase family protein [Oceanirhabdus seepicola]MCM1992612.1 flavin reductase family protein [Oceanirhabdus seepicola]
MKREFKGSAMLNPVPLALITSKDLDTDKTNVFTVGWIGTACTKPPMLSIAIRPERYSYELIKKSGELVVNLPSDNLVKAVDFCGVRSGREIDKIENFNLTLKGSTKISTPYIDECPVALECSVRDIIPLGTHDLFLVDVLCSHVNENIIDEKGKIHFENANLLHYCHGEYYPMVNKSIGSFGYSVRKKKKSKNKPNKKTNKK